MLDLLVIGAGLTGLTAALTAAEAGLNVRVISKGMGALHWSAGTIDVLGYLPAGGGGEPSGASWASRDAIEHPLAHLADLGADHPYARAGADATRSALAWFQALVAGAGLPYTGGGIVGADEANLWLPSPAGAMRPVYLAPAAQAAGSLHQSEPMLIVGLQGMRDFFPALIAENLGKQGRPARSGFVPVNVITDRRDASTVHLAQAFEQPERRRRFAEAVARLARPGERIGLPAILGLDDHAAVMADLESIAGAPVFEIPTLPPSVPGIRLYRALRSRLLDKGMRIEIGMEAIAFGAEGRQVRWVETETSARPLRHHAASFFLATGGILGGGFCSDAAGRFWEVVFDLPLVAPRERSQWFRSEFLDPRGHPVFKAGVAVNAGFQPIGEQSEPIYDNLWAAGGLLAHADPLTERSLEGLSVVTGRAAAQSFIRTAAGTPWAGSPLGAVHS